MIEIKTHFPEWRLFEMSCCYNSTVSPVGGMTAIKLVESINVSPHFAYQAFSIKQNPNIKIKSAYVEFFVKAAERRLLGVGLDVVVPNKVLSRNYNLTFIDLQYGKLFGSIESSISILYVGNYWYNIQVDFRDIINTGATNWCVVLYTIVNEGELVYAGEPDCGMYFYGGL
jgi:hypothetical protein